jgi:hypothetical protein
MSLPPLVQREYPLCRVTQAPRHDREQLFFLGIWLVEAGDPRRPGRLPDIADASPAS